jgi:hypothetical protein
LEAKEELSRKIQKDMEVDGRSLVVQFKPRAARAFVDLNVMNATWIALSP